MAKKTHKKKKTPSLTVEDWPLEKIIPYRKNPRKNEAAIGAVAKSIELYGPVQPIVVDGDGVIIIGHTRFLAAMEIGMTSFPVYVAAGLSTERARALRIADNKTGEIAEWDDELLLAELLDLEKEAIDIEDTGFSRKEIATLVEKGREPIGKVEKIPNVYGIYIECRDEEEQLMLLESLAEQGVSCRALIS